MCKFLSNKKWVLLVFNGFFLLSLETSEEIIKLQDLFYRPKDLSQSGQLETILKAVLKQNAMAMDSSIVDDVCLSKIRFEKKILNPLVYSCQCSCTDVLTEI